MNKVIDKLAWIFIEDGKLLMVRSKAKSCSTCQAEKRKQGK